MGTAYKARSAFQKEERNEQGKEWVIMMEKKRNYIIFSLCAALLLAGCSSLSPKLGKEPVEQKSRILVGRSLEVENTDSRFALVDDNSALAADGLYYVSWGMGDPKPYENSDGDTADLYDASLYLLLGESKDAAAAQKNMEIWLEAAKSNYEVLREEEAVYNGQAYTVLTYRCASEDNPYDRGVSAFAAADGVSLCVELTCQKDFPEELGEILSNFLGHCTIMPQE